MIPETVLLRLMTGPRAAAGDGVPVVVGAGRRWLTVAVSVLALSLAWCTCGGGEARAQGARSDFAVANGTVNAAVLSGGTLILGGSFTRVGPVTGSGVPVDVLSGMAVDGFPAVAGQVSAVAPDGEGGWYIGGTFTAVGGMPRGNLAHIRADNSVAAWDPAANNVVRALAVSGGTVYVAGDFSSVGGQARSDIAALDAATGLATAWNPGANGIVRALVVSGDTVYVGGQFTSVGGQPRNRIAALGALTGQVLAWNPGSDGTVRALALGGGRVYAGGLFSRIGGQSRTDIAALDAVTGAATTWNPSASGQVLTLQVSAGTVYAGGDFMSIGARPRSRIAALDAVTGVATNWNPVASSTVLTLVVSGGVVHAGGDFLSIGGQARSRVAALDITTGLATSWDPSAYGTVMALGVSGGVVYVGGSFSALGGLRRSNLAAVDVTTGVVTSWDPAPDGQVLSLALGASDDVVYVGGTFSAIGGQVRGGLAAVDAASGAIASWDPNADGGVSALAVSGGIIYAGGSFTSIGGQQRGNLAALDPASGLATPWAPEPDGQVFALAVAGDVVYVGGSFMACSGVTRGNIAAVSASTGLATAWAPEANGTVRALALTCGTVYAGGFFTTIGGQGRNRITALNVTSGLATAWNPNANGPVYALVLSGGTVYVGGVLNLVGGQPRNRIAALDPATGLATPWNPNADGTVRVLVPGGGVVYAAGSFTSMGGVPRTSLAAITADSTLACPAIALAPASLPAGLVGGAYAQTLAASGGGAPYCFAVSAGRLPGGLSLDPGTGAIQGTPTAAGAFPFTVVVRDARGCAGDRTYVLSVFSVPAQSFVAANTSGLCISTAHPCVSVPFLFARADSVPALAASVTFQIDVAKLSLCTPATPAASIHAGSWLAGFDRSFQVVDLGGGTYKVDQTILGVPCGADSGGQLFTVDLKSVGGDGSGAITVTAVSVRDCGNAPIAALPGAPASLDILNTPIAILPATLPGGATSVAYRETLTATTGVAPHTFTLAAGALPPGLALSAAGVLAGTPTASGTFAFTVGVSDSRGCPGSRAYGVTIVCSPVTVRPATLPSGVTGVAYAQMLTATTGRAPFTFALAFGTLPPGLSLSSGGSLSGTPTGSGTFIFTASATDANACSGSRSYTLPVFPTPPQSLVAADAGGQCITMAHPEVSVPFEYTRADTLPALGMSVTFQIDVSMLSLRTPLSPASSIHAGTWLAAFAKSFQVTDNGGGSYTVDQAILGSPCGATGGGELFSVDLKSTGDDGAGLVTVTAVGVRDCYNAPIPVAAGAPATLTIDNTGPAAIVDLAATQAAAWNDSGPTMGIRLTWSTGGAGSVGLYRAPFGSYPEYDDDGPVYPPDPAAAPGPPWTLVASGAASGYVDRAAPRGFWHYLALLTDGCGVVSMASNMTPGLLDYHLGDVSDGRTPGQGDARVRTDDVSLLGANYGIGDAEMTARHVEYLDIGPTTDGLPASRPTPDDHIDIEDLMIFSANYGVVFGSAAARLTSDEPAAARDEFLVTAPSLVEPGQAVTAGLRLRGAGRIQGFSARLAWDASVVQPLAMRSSGLLEAQDGIVLSPRPGTVDGALLGPRERGIAGDGVVATVTFRVLRAGDPAIRLAGVLARDAANRTIDADGIQQTTRPDLPTQTALLAPSPNPFREDALLTFSLVEPGPVTLVVYSVDGRRVRTLVNGRREAGVHHVTWDGVDDGHRAVAPGVFYAQLTAAGRHLTRRLVYLR